MDELLAALVGPNAPFLRLALLSGLLAAPAFGCLGTLVVVRRISYLAGAIAHSALGGIGLGLFVQTVWGITWFGPVSGAFVVALVAALILALLSQQTGEREDSLISAIWAGGMAAGLLFIALTPGYFDPMSYLFGNILLVSGQDCVRIAILDLVILAFLARYGRQVTTLCFDEEFARLRGVKTRWLYLLLLCLTAVAIVLLVRIVGIILVIALLTLPAATAGVFARNLVQMMILATGLAATAVLTGLGVSYLFDLPAGAVIILITTGLYWLVLAWRKIF